MIVVMIIMVTMIIKGMVTLKESGRNDPVIIKMAAKLNMIPIMGPLKVMGIMMISFASAEIFVLQ